MENFSLKHMGADEHETIDSSTVIDKKDFHNSSKSDEDMKDIMAAFKHIFEILALLERNKTHTLKQTSDGKFGLESSQGHKDAEKFMENVKDDVEDGDGSDLYIEVLKVPSASQNKSNGSADSGKRNGNYPKNIIESLNILDSEPPEELPEKKLSKSKRKLASLHPEKKHNAKLLKKEKLSKELTDPLLALS